MGAMLQILAFVAIAGSASAVYAAQKRQGRSLAVAGTAGIVTGLVVAALVFGLAHILDLPILRLTD